MNSVSSANLFQEITLRIIKEQEGIIGPLAWSEAAKVEGLSVTAPVNVSVKGDPKTVINMLVARYEKLFGRLSREICKEAVGDLTAEIPETEVPASLL